MEKGKNVKNFEIGDRVVADVGISVSPHPQNIHPRRRLGLAHIYTDVDLLVPSAITASTAGAAMLFFAKISMRAVLLSMAASQSTSCTTSVSAT